MIVIEVYSKGFNTKYVKYDPSKWMVSVEHKGNGIVICARAFDGIRYCSWGPFETATMRHRDIPNYVPSWDITVWD